MLEIMKMSILLQPYKNAAASAIPSGLRSRTLLFKFIIFAAAVFAYGFIALTSSWNKFVYNKTIIKEQYYVDIGTCLADD